MSDVNNSVTLAGRIGNDPAETLKSITAKGGTTSVSKVEVRLAVKDIRAKGDKTNWIPVEIWGRDAENLVKYKKKGDEIIVIGKLIVDEWQTEAGEKRSRIKVNASGIHFSSGGGENSGGSATASKPQNSTQSQDDEFVLNDDELPPF